MERAEEILIDQHIQEDDELRRYVEEHRRFEQELAVLNRQAHLTPVEEVNRRILQKKKLQGKEMILSLLERYRFK